MIMMKSIIYLIFLVISASGFAQSSTIVNDELFLKYEKEYLNYLNNIDSSELQTLDKAEASFYNMFNDVKDIAKFIKNKNQENWLQRNVSKTKYTDVSEAQKAYSDLMVLKQKLHNEGALSRDLLDQLVKKYEPELIWETLKSRIKNK